MHNFRQLRWTARAARYNERVVVSSSSLVARSGVGDRTDRLVRSVRLALVAIAIATVSGCTGHHTLVRYPTAEPAALAWFGPTSPDERARLGRWSSAVGPPVVLLQDAPAPIVTSIVSVTWNVALDEGRIEHFIADVRAAHPDSAIVLLIQEAVRSGSDVPAALAVDAVVPRRLGASGGGAIGYDVRAVAERCGLNLYYVPSMRNGTPAASNEDRGNAILSSLPLEDFSAIELPFESQRRVAVAATATVRSPAGEPTRIRFVSAHLDNMVGPRRVWVAGGMFARARQARGLIDTLQPYENAVLGGDFNAWFGFADPSVTTAQRAFPDTPITDRRPTFRNLLRLDHLFLRLPDGWSARVERAADDYGSDHWPLIAVISIG
jgi:endonuclease/exonuclease/phosphatase family metal-dependent hydrolase